MKRIIWSLIVAVSIALALVFSGGFIRTIHITTASKKVGQTADKLGDDLSRSTQEPEIAKQGGILIMGDSIGFGIGDLPDMGIGRRYTDLIGQDEVAPPQISNISVPGYLSGDLLALINEQANAPLIAAADTIIISIGGNDLNRVALQDTLTLDTAYQETLETYKENLQLIIKGIRRLNPEAQLALIGLYNPYRKEQPQNARLLLEWNYETRRIVNLDPKMAYVPTYEQFEYHLESYLAEDQFHPSSEGYQVIAEILYEILK